MWLTLPQLLYFAGANNVCLIFSGNSSIMNVYKWNAGPNQWIGELALVPLWATSVDGSGLEPGGLMLRLMWATYYVASSK